MIHNRSMACILMTTESRSNKEGDFDSGKCFF